MFLVYLLKFTDTIKYILNFVENHPISMGVIVTVTTGSLWFYKYLNQKRAEAFFGFYSKLSLRLRSLRQLLIEDYQLNISNSEDGNIYSLLYTEDFLKTVCPSYNKPDNLSNYQKLASELKNTLLETDSNVYPSGTDRREWYESQHILFDFCEFLENNSWWGRTNIKRDSNEEEDKHIIKCKRLIYAIDYILQAIENTKY